MVRIIQGNMDASGQRYGLVVSQFNSLVTERLQSGALDTLCRHGVSPETIDVVLVPGAYDIPLFAKEAGRQRSAMTRSSVWAPSSRARRRISIISPQP